MKQSRQMLRSIPCHHHMIRSLHDQSSQTNGVLHPSEHGHCASLERPAIHYGGIHFDAPKKIQ
jgi:hypothetical protein